ncbi:MAG: class I SAM-dependent methyltransferase [Burkholderiaceae bacterium]|nr:class I SAM-dependent methyltransferase [Burkholderiaceae bacterium]
MFAPNVGGAFDLRLRKAKRFSVELELGIDPLTPGFAFSPLAEKEHPEVDFSGTRLPWHLTRELLSHFPKANTPQSVALDLGCGTGLHREVCERAGFQWAGLDYSNRLAPILGDGHALPFLSNSVEFVLSLAVLEHIRHPLVLAREVRRVLKPGGHYIGTVAFLEPFHGDSYYHHTHLGTFNTLRSAGLEILHVGPHPAWSGLRAETTMGLFPRLPEWLATALVWPVEVLHRFWWRAGRAFSPDATESLRRLTNAGSFEFVARKSG